MSGCTFVRVATASLAAGEAQRIHVGSLRGASTPWGHGIGSVLRGGVAAASAVIGRDLMEAVVAGEGFGDRDRLPPLREGWDAWRTSH